MIASCMVFLIDMCSRNETFSRLMLELHINDILQTLQCVSLLDDQRPTHRQHISWKLRNEHLIRAYSLSVLEDHSMISAMLSSSMLNLVTARSSKASLGMVLGSHFESPPIFIIGLILIRVINFSSQEW